MCCFHFIFIVEALTMKIKRAIVGRIYKQKREAYYVIKHLFEL